MIFSTLRPKYYCQNAIYVQCVIGGIKCEKLRKCPDSFKMRRPGVEPGTSAWKAPMLTVTPSTLTVSLVW